MVVTAGTRVELLALSRKLPAMVSRAAHDLNNHLALILGKAELALLVADEGKYRSSLEEVYEAGQAARTLVADLQRVVAWSSSYEHAVGIHDVLSLVERMSARACRHADVQIVLESDSSTVEPPRAAALAALLWGLVGEALAGRDGAAETGESWTLSGSHTGRPGVSLETPRPIWSVESRAAAGRALRTGESLEGALGELVADVRDLGGSLSFDGAAVRIEL